MSQLVLWLFWLGLSRHSYGAFHPLLSLRYFLYLHSPFLSLLSRLDKAFINLKQPNKNKTHSIDEDHVQVFVKLWSDSPFRGRQLKYPAPIFAWRRTALIFFFSLKKSPQKQRRLSSFWGERKCSTGFRNAKAYFCNEILQGNGPMATAPITKANGKTQSVFCFVPQSPNQNEAEWTHPLFEMLKANLPQLSKNKKFSKKWTLLFLFGRHCATCPKTDLMWTLYFCYSAFFGKPS